VGINNDVIMVVACDGAGFLLFHIVEMTSWQGACFFPFLPLLVISSRNLGDKLFVYVSYNTSIATYFYPSVGLRQNARKQGSIITWHF